MRLIALFTILIFAVVDCRAQSYRKHELGITLTSSPPLYCCRYCYKRISPRYYMPENYLVMKVPFLVSGADTMYTDGYYRFVDSMEKLGIDVDGWFIDRWNEGDTTCLSSESEMLISIKIRDDWKRNHKPGYYYLDSNTVMHTSGFVQHLRNGRTYMGYGGMFSDSILLADKWYKIELEGDRKKKNKHR